VADETVEIYHPNIEGSAMTTFESRFKIMEKRGWMKVGSEHPTNQAPAEEEPLPEKDFGEWEEDTP
jgi:hypothetical protein